MRTISLKIPDSLDRELDQLASERHTTRSAIMREAIKSLSKKKKRSALDLAGDLVGCLHGPGDLSTNPKYMRGFGK
jgi:metal-responsive CopG/Arc/MetJ family transcriptional regulator